jgi:hypothetical protein
MDIGCDSIELAWRQRYKRRHPSSGDSRRNKIAQLLDRTPPYIGIACEFGGVIGSESVGTMTAGAHTRVHRFSVLNQCYWRRRRRLAEQRARKEEGKQQEIAAQLHSTLNSAVVTVDWHSSPLTRTEAMIYQFLHAAQ